MRSPSLPVAQKNIIVDQKVTSNASSRLSSLFEGWLGGSSTMKTSPINSKAPISERVSVGEPRLVSINTGGSANAASNSDDDNLVDEAEFERMIVGVTFGLVYFFVLF